MLAAAGLAGCGSTNYVNGRSLPPSGLLHRVAITVQNPSVLSKGAMPIVDAYYDIRSSYDAKTASFSVSGYGASLPTTIQNMPEEQMGAVYGSGDGSFTLIDYSKEKTSGTISGLSGLSASVFITKDDKFAFAASTTTGILSVVNQSLGTYVNLSLPNVYRVSVNPGGSVALAFVKNSDYVYYVRQLTTTETTAYAGGSSHWPKSAVDCLPQAAPTWCVFQAQSPDAVDTVATAATGSSVYYGAPLVFDRPSKAIFSSDGSYAYVLSSGPEWGGTTAAISVLPIAPMIFQQGKFSGMLPCNAGVTSCKSGAGMNTLAIAGGASNALVNGSVMYVEGQKYTANGWGGYLTRVDLSTPSAPALVASTSSAPNPVAITDGTPGSASKMVLADDNTLWIGTKGCDSGVRATLKETTYCLTMFNTSTNTITTFGSSMGDVTGIAAVTSLHKVYTVEGGQVYIHSTTDGSNIDNRYVTVTGTAVDVAYLDATTDTDNTTY